MLTQIDVQCDNPFYMSVLGARPRDSLILQSVTGLGPPDKSLYIGDYSRDGGVYGGRRVGTRNPVLTIQMNPNYGKGETVEGWRDILHRAFNDPFVGGDAVSLILRDDIKPDRVLTGYCEKFDDEMFQQETVVQISLICPDPYIRDVLPTTIEGAYQTVPFDYKGTAEAGFEIWMQLQATTSTLTLDNNGQTMILTYPFLAGDEVYVNTKPGQRQIKLTRGGVDYDILYALYSQSPWLTLHSQKNLLQTYGEDPSNFVASVTKLIYTQLWWGA